MRPDSLNQKIEKICNRFVPISTGKPLAQKRMAIQITDSTAIKTNDLSVRHRKLKESFYIAKISIIWANQQPTEYVKSLLISHVKED